MRFYACLGGLLLLCAGCAQLPKKVAVVVDGHRIAFERPTHQDRTDDERR